MVVIVKYVVNHVVNHVVNYMVIYLMIYMVIHWVCGDLICSYLLAINVVGRFPYQWRLNWETHERLDSPANVV